MNKMLEVICISFNFLYFLLLLTFLLQIDHSFYKHKKANNLLIQET